MWCVAMWMWYAFDVFDVDVISKVKMWYERDVGCYGLMLGFNMDLICCVVIWKWCAMIRGDKLWCGGGMPAVGEVRCDMNVMWYRKDLMWSGSKTVWYSCDVRVMWLIWTWCDMLCRRCPRLQGLAQSMQCLNLYAEPCINMCVTIMSLHI